jgi:hypothetical protein
LPCPDIELLARRFADRSLPRTEWTHQAHLQVGLWYVHQRGAAALDLLRAGIRRLNEAHGTPNTESSGYHETITAAYVRSIALFLTTCSPEATLQERAEALLAGPLGARDVLLRCYSREVLFSARARAEWITPDLAPLAALFERNPASPLLA